MAVATAERAPLLLSMAEIAELASVCRPVVTTWRRRHETFPEAVLTEGNQPLFDAHAVAEWLISSGRAERATVEPELWLYGLDRSGVDMTPSERIALITALICLRHLDGEELAESTPQGLHRRAHAVDPDDELLRAEIVTITGEHSRVARSVDELIEAAWGCQQALEWVLAARTKLAVPELGAVALAPELTELIVGLSGASDRAVHSGTMNLTDPAAGAGDLLTAALGVLPESCMAVVHAAEDDPFLARLLRRRLAVRDIAAEDRQVAVADGIVEDAENPDVVITQLPYEPAENRDALGLLNRIDDVLVSLALGRTAVVLGPADVLSGTLRPYSVAERARAKMLSSGMVEAVIRLPGGMVPHRPGYETALWVLTSAHGSALRGRVLLGDVSDRQLTSETVAELVTDVVTWRRDGYRPAAHTRSWCAEADVVTRVETPGPLTAPRVPTARERYDDVPGRVARISELESELAALADTERAPRPAVRTGLAQAQPAIPELVSIDRLIKAGHLTLIQGTRVDSDDLIVGGQHDVLGTPEVVRASGTDARATDTAHATRSLDRAVLALRYPRAKLTEPGDVLVTMSPAPVAAVDHDGFAVPEFPVRALRITDAGRQRLAPRVLAALLNSGSKERAARAVRAPRTLESWEITALDAGTVRRAETMLGELESRRAMARRELAALDEIDRLAAAGISDGSLTFA